MSRAVYTTMGDVPETPRRFLSRGRQPRQPACSTRGGVLELNSSVAAWESHVNQIMEPAEPWHRRDLAN